MTVPMDPEADQVEAPTDLVARPGAPHPEGAPLQSPLLGAAPGEGDSRDASALSPQSVLPMPTHTVPLVAAGTVSFPRTVGEQEELVCNLHEVPMDTVISPMGAEDSAASHGLLPHGLLEVVRGLEDGSAPQGLAACDAHPAYGVGEASAPLGMHRARLPPYGDCDAALGVSSPHGRGETDATLVPLVVPCALAVHGPGTRFAHQGHDEASALPGFVACRDAIPALGVEEASASHGAHNFGLRAQVSGALMDYVDASRGDVLLSLPASPTDPVDSLACLQVPCLPTDRTNFHGHLVAFMRARTLRILFKVFAFWQLCKLSSKLGDPGLLQYLPGASGPSEAGQALQTDLVRPKARGLSRAPTGRLFSSSLLGCRRGP